MIIVFLSVVIYFWAKHKYFVTHGLELLASDVDDIDDAINSRVVGVCKKANAHNTFPIISNFGTIRRIFLLQRYYRIVQRSELIFPTIQHIPFCSA